jgi:hypothetical protein
MPATESEMELRSFKPVITWQNVINMLFTLTVNPGFYVGALSPHLRFELLRDDMGMVLVDGTWFFRVPNISARMGGIMATSHIR